MCMCWECSTSENEKKLIEYGTWHSLIWQDGEDQGKAWLRWTMCKGEGKARTQDTIDCRGDEARVEGLVPMDQGSEEKRARLCLMDYEVHVKL